MADGNCDDLTRLLDRIRYLQSLLADPEADDPLLQAYYMRQAHLGQVAAMVEGFHRAECIERERR